MQNAKDTFYMMLRNRIAAANPARTVLVRSTLRSAVLVEENELVNTFEHRDAFVLRWSEAKVEWQGPSPLVTQRCEIRYATVGNVGNGGMDRGRLLAAMDAELLAAMHESPQRAKKQRYVEGAQAEAMKTSIFWSDVVLAPSHARGEVLERSATVDVFSYMEEGER